MEVYRIMKDNESKLYMEGGIVPLFGKPLLDKEDQQMNTVQNNLKNLRSSEMPSMKTIKKLNQRVKDAASDELPIFW